MARDIDLLCYVAYNADTGDQVEALFAVLQYLLNTATSASSYVPWDDLYDEIKNILAGE